MQAQMLQFSMDPMAWTNQLLMFNVCLLQCASNVGLVEFLIE